MREFVTHHQPSFLAWPGYWGKMLKATQWAYLTGVGFTKNDYQNRVRLGDTWLTVPVSAGLNDPLKDVQVSSTRSLLKIAKTIRQELMNKKVPHRDRLDLVVSLLEMSNAKWLVDLNISLDMALMQTLHVAPERVVLNEDPPDVHRTKTGRLAAYCEKDFEGEGYTYLIGQGTKSYFESAEFLPAEVQVQLMSKDTSRGTILEVLAHEDDPVAYLDKCTSWSTL